MRRLIAWLGAFGAAEDGSTALEYGLIVAFVVAAMMGGIYGVGGSVEALYRYFGGEASDAMAAARAGR